MKKKILSILITVLSLCMCMFSLTACGENEPPHTHTYSVLKYDTENHWHECSCGEKKDIENHKGGTATETNKATCSVCNQEYGERLGHVHTLYLTKVDAKPQSCTEEGNREYYTCSCGKWFTNNSATTEITDKKSVVIAKDAHKYETLKKTSTEHWWECSCGDKEGLEEHHGGNATCTEKAVCDDCGIEYGSKKSHSYTMLKQSSTQHWYECSCGAYETKENHIPGAEATGTTAQKCTECDYIITPALGHVHTLHLTKIAAKPQSCTEEGNREYYICSCSKWFTDNTATTEITDKDSVVIEKDAHKYETLKKTATEHWYECSCGDKGGIENHIPGAEATETTDQVCTECGYVITPALGHVHTLHLTKVDAKPQSCTKEGNIEYYTCSCGKWFTDNTATTEITDKDSVVIEKDAHKYETLKKTSTEHWWECSCGSYEIKENHKGGTATCQQKATCSVCDTVYGNYAEHEPNTAWVITDTHHYHECVYNCGEKLSYKEHGFTNYVSNKDATYESDGTKTATCNGGCGKTHTITDVGSMLIKDEIRFTTLTVDGKNVTGTVANAVERFYFADEIYLSGNANFVVSLDQDGIQSSITKSMPLNEGDNTFYVLETINGAYSQTYVITIHRNYMYTVDFMVDGEAIKTEQIEENHQVAAPIVQDKYSYTFDGWQVNNSFVSFPYTITKNTIFTAVYTPIPYNVTYHIDTYDSDGVITSKTETVVYTIEDMDNGVYTLKNTIIDDYVFYGWTTEKQFEPENIISSVNELNDYIFYGYYEYGTKGVVYEMTGETYAVTGYQGTDSEFIIAVLHNGLPVTTINPSALKDNLTVESITISKYISSIGLFAFNGCKNVTQVYYAADNCQNLAEDTRAFYYLGQNESGVTVTITDNVQRIPEHLFFAWILDTTKTYHPKLKTIQFEDDSVCQEIGKRAFGWCFEITSIEIPESIKTIGKEAFSKLYYVENIYFNAIECGDVAVTDKVFEDLSKHNDGAIITIGKNVTTIPNSMFNGLIGMTTNIKEISFATNGALTSIGSGAFAGAKKLTKVEIPEIIQNVELDAFMYCSSLTEFTVPKSVKVLYLSGCTSLQEITFNSVIEELYVDSCSSLTNVALPNTLKKVDFSFCTAIETLELPDGVTSAMFTGCSKLGTMTLPAGFTEVADNMFKNCSFLKGVEFEGEVTRIGDYAFSNCAMLGASLPYTVKHIGAHSYEYTAKTMFSASYNLESIGEYAFRGCSKLYYVSVDVKTISKYAFYNCTALDTLYIDFGIENIEEYAFYNTALTSVELPISVTKLGSNAFNYENFDLILENKVKPSEFLYSTYYSSDTTYGNNNITSNNYSYVIYNGEAYLTKYSGSETSVTVPDIIDGYPVVALVGTFYNNSSLTEVYIPDSITWVDYDAFYNCNNITAFYLYADNKPDNWHDSWNHNKTTYWDYQGVVSENGFDFAVIGEEAYIVGCNGTDADLVIPNTVNNKTIKGFMGEVFDGNTTIRTISIPETFVELPDKLFYNCISLTEIAIDNIKIIGKETFYGCTSLKEITLSSSLLSIGSNAFYNCSLETVTAPTIALPFLDNSNFKTVVINGGKEIPKSAFDSCNSLTSIVISDNVTSIGNWAFYSCDSLATVKIPNSVKSIGDYAFSNCSSLESVIYGENSQLISIGANAFADCSALTSIAIGDRVTSIGSDAFYGCDNLKYNLKNNLRYLGNDNNLYLYLAHTIDTSITDVIIDNYCKIIGDYAFNNCSSLTSIEIPDSVISIGESAFASCSSLTSIEIPDNVTSIGCSAFKGCCSLQEITLPFVGASKTANNGYDQVFGYIFGYTITQSSSAISGATYQYYNPSSNSSYNYKYYHYYIPSSLTDVTLSSSVTSIGNSVFNNYVKLASINIPNSITSIGSDAFYGCSNLKKVNYLGTIDEWVQISFDGTYANPLHGAGNLYINNTLITDIKLTTATKISNYAFSGYTSLISIEISDSVTSICDYAFYNCSSLTSVTIGNSVTSIGYSAFYGCYSLKTVMIGNSVTDIGAYAFRYCTSLTTIVIPNNINSMGWYVFENCPLTVYCELKCQPSDWDDEWNRESYWSNSKLPVVWDYSNNDVADDGYVYVIVDGLKYGIKDGVATVVKQARNITIANILESITYKSNTYSVTAIGGYAFDCCDLLQSVTIGDNIEKIKYCAFAHCGSLTNIVIPDNVTSMVIYAFYECDNLTSITFEGDYIWYRTTNYDDWENKINGTQTDVTEPSSNATNLTSTYCDYYWYKK